MTRIYKLLFLLGTVTFWSFMFTSISWQNIRSSVNYKSVTAEAQATQTSGLNLNRSSAWSQTHEPVPLLVLFTTFKEAPERFQIQMNTILNWELLYPAVQPLLFSTDTDSNLSHAAMAHHWLVLPVPAVSSYGTPYFKDMYYSAYNNTRGLFYAYSNADIFYTPSLIDTLRVVNKALPNDTTLITGRRINIVRNYTDTIPFYKPHDIIDFASKSGKLYRIDAEDYFAIGNIHKFPWELIKNVVIGRPAYDNYVVGLTCHYNVSVVDATKTIKAIHLSGGTSKFNGSNNKDRRYNFKVIGKFNWAKGYTTSVPFFTQKFAKKIIVKKRKKRC